MAAQASIDPELKQWATETQARYLEAVNKHGSMRAAARALGLNKNSIIMAMRALKTRAAAQGYAPDHDMTHKAPAPFMVKGVSTYYGRDGDVRGQWVKTQLDADKREALIRTMVAEMAQDVKGLCPITPAPAQCDADLLSAYLFGDPHFGLRANADECGEAFDLSEADRLTRAGIDSLVRASPPARTALLMNAGDNTHANDESNRTPGHGNPLDADGRHSDARQVSARAWIYAIRRCLEKHEMVHVWFLPGNHDPETSGAIALCLSLYFESEPRVIIDIAPGLFRYLRFGKVLIGAHHGHATKAQDMPLLMAVDRPQDWGETVYRYVYMGHIHHDTIKEVQGVRVESLRTLAGKDAWHTGKGYRSMRDTRLVVHHREFGEIERHTRCVAMLAPGIAPVPGPDRLRFVA